MSLRSVVVVLAILAPATARAGSTEPDPRADDAFDFMNLLARRKLHNLDDERWNVYGQLTFIDTLKLPFRAPYTSFGGSPNSLSSGLENSYTATLTIYGG